MSGSTNGAAALIWSNFPKAIYMHCASHRLDLCVAASCKTTLIMNMMDHVRVMSDFFKMSTKRAPVLKDMIHQLLPNASKDKLISICKTRWVVPLDGLDLFVSYYPAIIPALESMKDNKKDFHSETVKTATGLFYLASSFELSCWSQYKEYCHIHAP